MQQVFLTRGAPGAVASSGAFGALAFVASSLQSRLTGRALGPCGRGSRATGVRAISDHLFFLVFVYVVCYMDGLLNARTRVS